MYIYILRQIRQLSDDLIDHHKDDLDTMYCESFLSVMYVVRFSSEHKIKKYMAWYGD